MTTEAVRTVAGTEHDERVTALRQRMAEQGLAAVVAASPEAIYYLTGFDHLGYFAFTALIVPEQGNLVIVTREMERPTVRAQIPHCRHAAYGDGADPAVAVSGVLIELAETGTAVGVEYGAMFFPPAIYDRIRAAVPEIRWRDAGPLITRAMAVKSETEIDAVRRAATLSDAAMAAGIEAAGIGVADHAAAAAIHNAMFALGGQQPGFVPLIRPLEMLGQEHITWRNRIAERGGGLFLELSACVRRYHAPLSRTVYIGHAPKGAADAHARALAGLHAAREALRPGVPTGEVYTSWQRAVTGSRALDPPLRHHCGYLVGIGFPPSWVGGGEVLGIRPGGDTLLVPGMTFHLMSWVSGHVISDTALVTGRGAELLTSTPRDLLVVT